MQLIAPIFCAIGLSTSISGSAANLWGEGDVAACYAQCPEPQDGSFYVVWLHGEVAIGPVDTVRFDPVVVDDRRARLVDGHAHDASQFERNVVGHGLRAVFSSSFK